MALKIKSIIKSTYLKILIYVAAPVFIAFIFILMLFIVYSNNYKNSLKASYEANMQSLFLLQDQKIQDIAFSLRTIYDDTRFIGTVNGALSSQKDITHAQKILKQIQLNYSFIDNISIVERTEKQVYTSNNVYPMSNYFFDVYKYDNYDYNYWMQYKSPLSEKVILSPTNTLSNNLQKTIIPIVFTRIGRNHLSNIIIVNVDLSTIISDFKSNQLSDGTLIGIVNKENNLIFDEHGVPQSLDNELLNKINLDTVSVFDYIFNSKKHFTISYMPTRSVLGYSYIAAIPYSDIYRGGFKLLTVTILLFIPMLALLLFIIKFSSRQIYSPFKSMATIFGIDTSGDTEKNIQNNIKSMLDSNKKMSSQIKNTLPIIEEQYLIRVLNSSEHYYSSEDISNNVQFDYDYFCSVIIKFNWTELSHKKYDYLQTQMMECSMAEIIHELFAAQFNTYIIPSDSSTLYILLNIKEEQHAAEIINATLDDFRSILYADEDDVKIITSVGSIYPELSGLKKSHTEALKNISGTTWLNKINIHGTPVPTETQAIKFTANDESVICNHLIAGNTDDAITVIDTIISNNANTKKYMLMHIYIQILNIIFKTMRIKNIEYDTERVGDLELLNEITSHSPSEVYNIIVGLIDKLKKTNNVKKISVDNVLKYIQQHYKEYISLDNVADHFNTSASYLSRLIKKETSQTFNEYMNSLRIEEAKTLLESTDKSVTEIYQTIGFTNRSTFIRVFKTFTGVTPSEFRASLKN